MAGGDSEKESDLGALYGAIVQWLIRSRLFICSMDVGRHFLADLLLLLLLLLFMVWTQDVSFAGVPPVYQKCCIFLCYPKRWGTDSV